MAAYLFGRFNFFLACLFRPASDTRAPVCPLPAFTAPARAPLVKCPLSGAPFCNGRLHGLLCIGGSFAASAHAILRAHEAGHSMRRGLMLVGLINHRCFQG